MRVFGAYCGILFVCAAPIMAQTADDAPLSAIDWLSESVEQPPVVASAPVLGTQGTRTPDANEAPVANSATIPNVSVRPLGGPAPRALGILAPKSTGFALTLWENSDAETLAALLLAQEIDTLPAIQELITTLALTQTNPARFNTQSDPFFQARVDKLLGFGALEPAQALLESATPETPELFRRWFDVSLLTGTENAACRGLRERPAVAPTPAARIFCLARSGDWPAAALTLNTGLALGDIDDATGYLLTRFLDPDLFEGEPYPSAPSPITPLKFRMFEAIGAPQTTNGLPRAFAHADLRPNVGWKAQLEAAERLARSGSISPNTLVGLYTARVPAASGGVWERAKAVARLENALASQAPDALDNAIHLLWDEAEPVGVTVQLAQFYAPDLLTANVETEQATLFKLLLMSDLYEEAALNPDLASTNPFWASVARGDPSQATPSGSASRLVRDAFAAQPDANLLAMAQEGRSGEAILRTIATLQQGIDGDDQSFQDGIATLRALGLEDAARRTALQFLILS